MLWIIPVALIAAALLAALIPLRVNFRLSTAASSIQIHYGPFRLTSTRKVERKTRTDEKTEKAESGKKKKRRKRRTTLLGAGERFAQALRVLPGLGKAALNFAGRIFKQAELTDFSGRVAGGLGDPALTGMAAGWVHSLFAALPRLGKYVVFEPDYLADWPVVEISGKARFRPLDAALPAIQFIREAPLTGIYRFWRPSKAKKKSK